MSSVISGSRLQCYTLPGGQKELEGLGEWTISANFEPISDRVGVCRHKDRFQRLKPILTRLKELNFKARNFHRE
jgi:hypothetical protein